MSTTEITPQHKVAGSSHWLTFDNARHVAGCHCGFKADPSDKGYGDSVVAHLLDVRRPTESAESVWRPSDGDARCQKCGRPNPAWFTDSETWNSVMGDEGGVLCPTCFALTADALGDKRPWRLAAEQQVGEWHDHMGDNLADPLRNIERACDQMLAALNEGRYNHGETHVRADLNYLRAEARRALRHHTKETR